MPFLALSSATPKQEVVLDRIGQVFGFSAQDVSFFRKELTLLLEIALPTMFIEVGFTIPGFLASSYVGRVFGHEYLSGMTLALLTANLSTLAILNGLFCASDTLSPQAFAAGNYRHVGILAVRGYVLSLCFFIIPINVPLAIYLRDVLVSLGQDELASYHAQRWYRIFVLSLPFQVLFLATWKFLAAQATMRPLTFAVLFSTLVILPLSLEVFAFYFDYLGTALSVVVFHAFESLSLLGYLWWRQPHHPETWPGLDWSVWKEAADWKSSKEFLSLGVGGVLSASEWIAWEIYSLFAGLLGILPLSVHTIPVQLMLVAQMFPMAVSGALTVRVGAILTAYENAAHVAKRVVYTCLIASLVLFGALSLSFYMFRYAIYSLFTSEDNVIEGCDEIWKLVCLFFYVACFFLISTGVATALGMQCLQGALTVVSLWVVGIPAAYYFSIVKQGGLIMLWTWLLPPYIVITMVLIFTFLWKDWGAVVEYIRLREAATREGMNGELDSLLLSCTDGDVHYDSTAQSAR